MMPQNNGGGLPPGHFPGQQPPPQNNNQSQINAMHNLMLQQAHQHQLHQSGGQQMGMMGAPPHMNMPQQYIGNNPSAINMNQQGMANLPQQLSMSMGQPQFPGVAMPEVNNLISSHQPSQQQQPGGGNQLGGNPTQPLGMSVGEGTTQQNQAAFYWNAIQAQAQQGQHQMPTHQGGTVQSQGNGGNHNSNNTVLNVNVQGQQRTPQPQQASGTLGNAQELLRQQQDLIASLQKQIAQQQQQASQFRQEPQQGGMSIGGVQQQQPQMLPNNNHQFQQHLQQQFGIPSQSPSMGGGQQPQQQSAQIQPQPQHQQLQFPPALQGLMQRQESGSFGLQIGALGGMQQQGNNIQQAHAAQQIHPQQQIQQHLQQGSMPTQGNNNNNMASQSSHQTKQQLQQGMMGGQQYHQQHQRQQNQNQTTSTPNTPLLASIPQSSKQRRSSASSASVGGGGQQSAFSSSSHQGSPRHGSRNTGRSSANPPMQSNNGQLHLTMPNQHVMDNMRRLSASVSTQLSAGNNSISSNPRGSAVAGASQGQPPQLAHMPEHKQQKQQQLLMAHMLHQQSGGNSTTAPPGGSVANASGTNNAIAGGDSTTRQQRLGSGRRLSDIPSSSFQHNNHTTTAAATAKEGARGKQSVIKKGQSTKKQVSQKQPSQKQPPPRQQVKNQVNAPHQQGQRNNHGLPNINVNQGGKNNEERSRTGASSSAPEQPGASANNSTVPPLVFTEDEGKILASTLRRGSSTSQGSLYSQGSLSQGPLGIVDPDPIAEGVSMKHNSSGALLVGSAKSQGDGKQSFLDGHFAGGWQSNADLPDRRRINFHIIKVIERMRPDANRMSQNRLPLMAKKLEEHIYRSAHTKDEYINPASLKRRLHLIAKGVGIPKIVGDVSIAGENITSGESADDGGILGLLEGLGDTASNQGSASNNRNAVPMETLSRGNNSSKSKPKVQPQLQQQQLHQLNPQQDRFKAQVANDSNKGGEGSVSGLPQDGLSLPSSQDPGGTKQEKPKGSILLQQQRRLLLLRHAAKCDGGPTCQTKFCPQMTTLWKHMKKCRDKICKVSHCLSSRCVLNHYRGCKSRGMMATCVICAPVMKKLSKTGEGNVVSGDDEFETLEWTRDGLDPLDAVLRQADVTIDANGIIIGDGVGNGQESSTTQFDKLDAAGSENAGGCTTKPNQSASMLSPNPELAVGINQPQQPPQDPPAADIMLPPQQPPQDQLLVAMQPGNAILLEEDDEQLIPGTLPALRQALQKKQLLLQQVQQQKANIFGQNQKFQQQLQSLSNPQQIQQIQKQQTILEELSQQFEKQLIILQREINRQYLALQKMLGNVPQEMTVEEFLKLGYQAPPLSPSIIEDFNKNQAASVSKRSADEMPTNDAQKGDDELRPSKMAKTGDASPSLVATSSAPSQPPPGAKTDQSSERKSPEESYTDKGGSSIITSMPIPAIEQHLDSLVNTGQMTPRYIASKCIPLVKKLINHEHGWVFKDAVDPIELGIPDYFDIVDHPMDLTLVKNKLEDGAYKEIAPFERDTKLVFENAILFNGEDSDVGAMAKELLEIFNAGLQETKAGLNYQEEPPTKRGNSCGLCGNYRRLYNPPALFCSGVCGMQKIRRKAPYYTDRFKQNYWCEGCYTNHLKEGEPVQLDDGRETRKSLLVRMTNDSTPEEAWVQCDNCQTWNHQVCALFNSNSKSSTFICPKCYIKEHTTTEASPPNPSNSVKGAKELPHCNLSKSIEDGLQKTLLKAYEKVAQDRGCTVSQVEKAEGLNVRVVSCIEKKHKMRARYSKKGYPTEFKVRTKCIVLFQKIHGVDVLLFGMYVYEYGDECKGPNRRRVYISYLDSARYMEPSSYRTITYQSIIIEYLRFVKKRGFHTAHIWSCPPSKGDEYIFHCHPNQQLTPNDDLLCAWYVDTLNKAKEEGIVLETWTLYDEYFKNNAINPETGELYDATSLPYFDGDYIPGEIEKIIKDINQDDSMREGTKLRGSGPTAQGNNPSQKKEAGKRVGTRSNPGELVNQARDKVMNRLDLVLARMKKNFMVVQLLSDDFIAAVEKGEDVSSWTESGKKPKQKGKNPNLLEMPDGTDRQDSYAAGASMRIVGDTKDHDPVMEQECIDTRLQFLNYCQRNNYQFDELRRAKYTSMMLLAHLHNPRAEQDQQLKAHLNIVVHAASCNGEGCTSSNCKRMKQLFGHITRCDVTYRRGCKMCFRLFMLLTKHSSDCDLEGCCPVPYCDRIKERTRTLLKRQQIMDDRRRDAQNDRAKPQEDNMCA